jgi:aspartyl-tRNA(Asn)/glutamyl-tRNA(Gln) amidotransferase subunit C
VKVTADLVRQVAALARLDLTEEEVVATTPRLQSILDHVERLQRVDLKDEDPATQSPIGPERLRDDVPGPTLPRDRVLANAPKHDGTMYVVPKFFED